MEEQYFPILVRKHYMLWYPATKSHHVPPRPLAISPLLPLRGGGGASLGPKSIENTRRQRRQRNFLQGAEADLHCDWYSFVVQSPPPPRSQGGGPSLHDCSPPSGGGTSLTKGGRLQRGWGVLENMQDAPMVRTAFAKSQQPSFHLRL